MLPELKVPKSKIEREEWAEDIHKNIEQYYSSYFSDQREKDFDNYNIFNGIIDKDQFQYVTDTYSNTNPARFVHYPIMKKMIELIIGEWLGSPMDLSCELVNEDAVNRKFDKKVNVIFEALIKPYRKELEKMAGIQLGEDTLGMEIPENLDEFVNSNFRENTEDVVLNGLKYLMHKHDLKNVFKRGLYDFAITSKQFYKIDIINDDPVPRRVDPRNLIYDVHTDVEDLSRSEWIAEQRYMTVSEILGEFRHDLDKPNRDKLHELRRSTQAMLGQQSDSYTWYKFHDNHMTHIRVIHAEWRAIKEVLVKVSENKYNSSKPFYKFLPENYKKKPGERVEKIEVVEVWESTRIGPEIYIKLKPSDFMVTREEWGYQEVPLSYVGCIQHNIDGVTVSLVDLMKQLSTLYDITMFNIELIMQRSAGKAVFYDVAQIPEGMELDDVIYQARNHGFIWINSAQEGAQLRNPQNQFQSVDFTMSNSLTQLINLKMIIEQTIYSITGINEARAGASKPDAPVGTTEGKIQQSSYITQSFYFNHVLLMEKVFTRMADLMKIAWAGRKKFNFPLGETGAKFIKLLNKEELSMNDYSIFIKNSIKDQRNKQIIVQLSEAALRGGQINFLDLVKILNADTAKETEKVLDRSIKATQKANEEMRAQQQQMQQQAMQQQGQMEKAKLDILSEGNKAKVEAAQVAADGKVRAEEVEQTGKREHEDQRYKRNLDTIAYGHSVAEDQGLIEINKKKLGQN